MRGAQGRAGEVGGGDLSDLFEGLVDVSLECRLDGIHADLDGSNLGDGGVSLEMKHQLLHSVQQIGHLAIFELRGHQLRDEMRDEGRGGSGQ